MMMEYSRTQDAADCCSHDNDDDTKKNQSPAATDEMISSSSSSDFKNGVLVDDTKKNQEDEISSDVENAVIAAGPEETTMTNSSEQQVEQQDDDFAKRETKAVFWLKVLVLVVLVVSAVCVALAVFFYTSLAEKNKFEEAFVDASAKVFESVGGSLDLSLGAVDSFVISLVSFARYANMTWPFVTLPDYSVRIAKVRSLSKAFVSNLHPIVTAEQRAEWEKYSVENDGWVQEGLDIQKDDKNFHGTLLSDYEGSSVIYDNSGGPSTGPGPFLPVWQSGPVVPVYPPYNWDGASYSSIINALAELLGPKRVVIGKVSNLPDSDDKEAVAETEVTNDWAKDYIRKDEDPSEPLSDLYYPILDDAPDEITHFGNEDQGTHNVVAILSMSFFWRDLIRDIMPPGANGVVCVFENTCDQAFTYQINGPEVAYLGHRDLHDSRYDYLEQSSDFLDLGKFSTRDLSYTGIPLSGDICPYTLRVYPSADMEEDFSSRDPIVYTVVALIIFAFTSAVFLIYDCCVDRRQRKVMNTAVQSTVAVSVLEEKVKERTLTLEETNKRLEEANRRVLSASAAQLQHFACMSHEIRTPLNCIIGLSSLLQDTKLDPTQKESVQMIVTSGNLLLTIVNDVLDYSKLESGNVDIDIKRSNLQETLTTVVHAIETKGKSKGVSVRTWYGLDVCEFISTDSRRLQQILFNLLGNAIKFSEDGGVVEVAVSLCSRHSSQEGNAYSPSETGKESLRSQNDELVLRFSVKDYGKGIHKKDFEKIFQPFLQASTETERIYGGSGLGLAITAKLVRALGGTISVESEEGKWSKFSVDFPFNDAPADVERISAELTKITILVVGAQAETLDQVINIFRRYCVEFAIFSSSSEFEAHIRPEGGLSRDRSYVCLVDEDLYDRKIAEFLSTDAKSILLTYGPKYGIKEAHGQYRSLVQLLPSVLMKSVADHVKASDQAPLSYREEGSSNKKAAIVRNLRILIAEDNVVNQKVLSRILTRLGLENVEIVDNGQKAVDREVQREFDVVLMDMQMPVMDGIEACQLISTRQGGHPKAKVVFVTAHVSDSFEADCLEAGASGFLPKPCNLKDVEKCLQRVASER